VGPLPGLLPSGLPLLRRIHPPERPCALERRFARPIADRTTVIDTATTPTCGWLAVHTMPEFRLSAVPTGGQAILDDLIGIGVIAVIPGMDFMWDRVIIGPAGMPTVGGGMTPTTLDGRFGMADIGGGQDRRV
jgi:hypothetical protein